MVGKKSENLRVASPITDFEKLFQITEKKEAISLLRGLVLDCKQFGDLIIYANKKKFAHEIIVKDWIQGSPEKVPDFINAISTGSKSSDPEDKKKGSSGFKAIKALFEQRKQMFVHIFKSDTSWHIFYFSGADYNGVHFEHPHFHYTSNLWGHDLTDIKAKLNERTYSFSNEHLYVVPLVS